MGDLKKKKKEWEGKPDSEEKTMKRLVSYLEQFYEMQVKKQEKEDG